MTQRLRRLEHCGTIELIALPIPAEAVDSTSPFCGAGLAGKGCHVDLLVAKRFNGLRCFQVNACCILSTV